MLLFAAEDLQLNSGTALGFDTDNIFGLLEGCRFRRVGSAYASRCTPLASKFSQTLNLLRGSNVLSVTQNQDLHTIKIIFLTLAVIAMHYQ